MGNTDSGNAYGDLKQGVPGLPTEAAALRVDHRHHRYMSSMNRCNAKLLPLTLMQVIRSVIFDESEANSMRTISLDSSTTVDDISMITSLQNSALTSKETASALTIGMGRQVESIPLKRQRSSDSDWSDARVRIGGKGKDHN